MTDVIVQELTATPMHLLNAAQVVSGAQRQRSTSHLTRASALRVCNLGDHQSRLMKIKEELQQDRLLGAVDLAWAEQTVLGLQVRVWEGLCGGLASVTRVGRLRRGHQLCLTKVSCDSFLHMCNS